MKTTVMSFLNYMTILLNRCWMTMHRWSCSSSKIYPETLS